jgi:chromosome segregation ATPase
MISRSKEQLMARMKEIEEALSSLREEFKEIKKRSRSAVEDGLRKRDEKKIEDIRKQLGL